MEIFFLFQNFIKELDDKMIPIRCISCGKPVSAYFNEYQTRVADGEDSKAVLDDMGIKRYCCRRMLISHVETWE